MKKIIFEYKNEFFLFAAFKRASSDGSFLWWFERSGKSQTHFLYSANSTFEQLHQIQKEKDKKIGISYHTTGCIHYKAIENNPKIFAESLFEIKRNFCFALFSIPAVSKLDKFSKNKIKNNIVIKLNDHYCFEYRTTFSLTITPYNSSNNSFFKIDYINENFTVLLNIENTSLLSTNHIDNSFVFMRPKGLFDHQQNIAPITMKDFFRQDEKYDEQWALIKYHQKINSANEIIVYEQNDKHEYRMIFSVPMRIPPKITILFDNQKYTIKCVEHKNTYILFKIVDDCDIVIQDSQLIKILNISLDSEL